MLHANASEMVEELARVYQFLKERLTEAQDTQAHYYDQGRQRLVLAK